MGIFDRITGSVINKAIGQHTTDPATGDSRLNGPVEEFVQKLLDVGVDGAGPVDGAAKVADKALRGRSPEQAVGEIVKDHKRIAATGGFVTGLAETIGTASADSLGLTSTFAITIFAVILAIIISETTSNTASAAVVVPIIIPVAVAAGINPFVPALAATFAASFGFMLPVSTPQNAIVYGSGVVPITKMIRSGISFDVLGALLIVVLLPVLIDLVLSV